MKTEEEQSQFNNYPGNIINSLPSILISIDTKYNITFSNKTAEKTSGTPVEKMYGKQLLQVFPVLADFISTIDDCIREKTIKQHTAFVETKPGVKKYFHIIFFPIDNTEKDEIAILINDRTEELYHNETIFQKDKMQTISTMAAGVAHEINNPLTSILLTTSNISNRLGLGESIPANEQTAKESGTTLTAIRTYLEKRNIDKMILTIKKACQEVTNTLNTMLSYARDNNTGNTKYNISELIDKTISIASSQYDMKKQYNFKHIAIIKEYSENLPLVECDDSKIKQVILSILYNGTQSMKEAEIPDPGFTIRTYCNNNKNMVCFEIEDNGPGMDEKIQKRIFEPFFTTKGKENHTGLGMSTAYNIIKNIHNGEIDIKSEPGKGSNVIVSLPLKVTNFD